MLSRVWTAIIIGAFGFGTAGVATSAALTAGVEPITLATVRALMAAALIYGYMLLTGRQISRERAVYRVGGILAVLQLAVPFILFTLAYLYASAGFVGLFAALFPLATALLAHFFVPGERLRWLTAVGLLVALAGVGVMLASGDSGLAEGGRPLLAGGLSLAAVASIAGAGIVAKRSAGVYGPVEITGLQHLLGGVILVAVMLGFEGVATEISAWGWMLLSYIAVMGSAVPFLVFYWLLSATTVTRASLMGYLVPGVALVGGILLLDEQLQPGIALGGVLIVIGVIWTDRAQRQG